MDFKLYMAYMILLTLLSQLAAYRYEQTDKALRFITWFIWISIFSEVVGRIAARQFHNNMFVMSISTVLELGTISLYYNYSIETLRKYYIGYIIAGAGVVIAVVNHIWFQSIFQVNSNFHFIQCIIIACLSFYAIYKVLEEDNDKIPIHRRHLFWVPIILVFFHIGVIWHFLSYEYLLQFGEKVMKTLSVLTLSVALTTYGMLAILYLFLPKMEKNYA